MHIQELTLYTRRLNEQKAFYHTTLGLPLLAETPTSFTLQAGTTRLHFQTTEQDVLYHVAFTIPRNTYASAKAWLKERQPLLKNEGEDEIFFRFLNARSFYFLDAENNILEFIAHYKLENETEGAFKPTDILHISEIGLAVEDVPPQVALLQEKLGIEPYGGPASPNFAFMGDIYGQFVVVKTGRPWLPTKDVLAIVSPAQVTISGQQEQQIELSPFPYTIKVVPS